ncbi:MAG: S41 family peptidase [Balneolaceae bacterium]
MGKITPFQVILFLFFCSLWGCKEQIVGEDHPNTYLENFESLWRGFDANYSYFEHKNINWDSLYIEYAEQVDTVTSDSSLFDVLSEMLSQLRDGHASVSSKSENYSYTGWRQTFYDPLLLQLKYLENIERSSIESPFLVANIGDSVAYIHINSFEGSLSKYKEIDSILENFSQEKGLILDLRTNGGGKDINAHEVLSKFAAEKTLIRKIRYRNGPNHSDFSKPIIDYISPSGFYYGKKVIVLTDRSVFSAAEDFVLGMRQFSNVTILGQRTGGGSGNPITFDLPNGWLYTVSRWQIFQPESDSLYEGIGLIPDILVPHLPRDDVFLLDGKVETAVRLILDQ